MRRSAVVFAGLPNRLGLLVGGLVGVVAGTLADRETLDVTAEAEDLAADAMGDELP